MVRDIGPFRQRGDHLRLGPQPRAHAMLLQLPRHAEQVLAEAEAVLVDDDPIGADAEQRLQARLRRVERGLGTLELVGAGGSGPPEW